MKKVKRYVNKTVEPVPYVVTDFSFFSHLMHIYTDQWLGLTPLRVKDHIVMSDPNGTGYHYLMRYADFKRLTPVTVTIPR